MRSRLVLLGVAGSGTLTVVAVVGAVLGWWWLVVLAAMLLVSGALMAALDADRRIRELRAFTRAQLASIDTSAGRAAPTQDDVVGTVRLLQAQYTARLDRMQDALEQVLGTPQTTATPPPATGDGDGPRTPSPGA